MPYEIRKRGDRYCVVRPAEGDRPQRTLGCHDTRADAERQRRAIGARTHSAVENDDDGPRYTF